MFERFDRGSRSTVVQARTEARRSGSTRLEAEHLLLALSRQRTSDAGRILAQASLDHDGLGRALDAELRRGLDAAGVDVDAVALAERPLPAAGEPRWGASAKLALQRALTAAKERGDRQLRPIHILLGILRADEGTVPRALHFAGVDAEGLVAAAEATLDSPTD